MSDARLARLPGLVMRTALAVAGAAVVGAVALSVAGLPLGSTFVAILQGAVGSDFAIRQWLTEAVPITLTALGVSIAFRAGLFNLGGEGQIYMGALGTVVVALLLGSLPGPLLIVISLLIGALAGAAWGAIAGVLRARLGLSEIITTIMLNFVAFWIVSYLVRGPIQDPSGGGYPYTKEVAAGAQLGSVGGVIPVGALIMVAFAALAWILLERTGAGLRIKHCGLSEAASRFAGVRIERVMLLAMTLAGALAGLGGGASLLGNQHRLSDFFSPNWGFDAVAIALIGRGSAPGTLAAGLFIAGVTSGINEAQATAQVPSAVAQILLGTIVLFLIVANADVAMRRARSINLDALLPRRLRARTR